nr:DUF3575 domain-containing protein [uncultured Flavobacterium sp.]
MKKTFLIAVILFSFSAVKAQNQNEINVKPYEKKNEVTLNLFAPIAGAFDASYERHLNRKSSLGISFLYVYNNKLEEDMNYYISPYYRMYFGQKYASGFFVEGFGLISSIDGKKIYDTEEKLTFTKNPDVIDLTLGIGLGWKGVTKSGFTYGANLGWGKLLFNADKTDHTAVVKFGLNLGYRF